MKIYRNIKSIPEIAGLTAEDQKLALKYAQLHTTFTLKFAIAFMLAIISLACVGSITQSLITNNLTVALITGAAAYIVFAHIISPIYIHQARPHIAHWRKDHKK